MLKGLLLVLFFWRAANDDNRSHSVCVDALIGAVREAKDLSLNTATLTDDLAY